MGGKWYAIVKKTVCASSESPSVHTLAWTSRKHVDRTNCTIHTRPIKLEIQGARMNHVLPVENFSGRIHTHKKHVHTCNRLFQGTNSDHWDLKSSHPLTCYHLTSHTDMNMNKREPVCHTALFPNMVFGIKPKAKLKHWLLSDCLIVVFLSQMRIS